MAFYHAYIGSIIQKWWEDVCQKVNKAVVFLDDGAAECLHWNGGLLRLINAGAVNAKILSSFERGLNNQKKVVFLVTSPLHGETLNIIKDIITSSSFECCAIITTIPSYVYMIAKPGSTDLESQHVFYAIEEKLLSWMGNMNYTSKIFHIPIFAGLICPNLFIMPAFANIFPVPGFNSGSLHKSDWRQITNTTSGYSLLSTGLKMAIKSLVHSLNSLFDFLKIREDIYSLGQLSHIIANELENHNDGKTRRKNAAARASVLFIDRTVDLAGALTQSTDSLLDRILRVLPHLSGFSSDVAVDMTSLSVCKRGEVFGNPILAPGCLAHKEIPKTSSLLNTFIIGRPKETIIEIFQELKKIALKEGISLDDVNKDSHSLIEKIQNCITVFRQKPAVIINHAGFLEQALAVVQTYESPTNKKLDELHSTEKLILQNMTVIEDTVSSNIIHLISHRNERGHTLEDIIALMAYLFSLNGSSDLPQISLDKIQATLFEAIFQDSDHLPEFIKKLVGETIDEVTILSAVRKIFAVLENIKNERQHLKKYRSLLEIIDPAVPAVYKSLMRQIIEDIFNPTIDELSDIEFHSAGLNSLLRTGFSLFMNVSKSVPRDHPLLIIILIGGVTASEVKQVREVVSEIESTEVIIGATRLITPVDALEKLFFFDDETETI